MEKSRYLNYLNNPIYYKDDKLLSDHVNFPIMGQHEELIMKESAEVVCQNGGKILNVGFGMGIIDTFIRNNNPTEHHIVDVHPGVINKAKEMGFDKAAILYESDWRDLIKQWNDQNIQFDGIYFDTIILDWERSEWDDFAKVVDTILAPNGIFCFFNNSATKYSQELWKILKELKYRMYSKQVPYSDIFETAIHKEDMKHLLNMDYNLIWYKKVSDEV